MEASPIATDPNPAAVVNESSQIRSDSHQGDVSMRRCIWVACAVIAVFSSSALARADDNAKGSVKSPDVERIMSVGHEESQVMDHLDVLCNRIGPQADRIRQLDERV